MEKLGLSHTTGRNGKWWIHPGKQFDSSSNGETQNYQMTQPFYATSTPERIKNIRTHKTLHIVVYSRIFHNSQKVEATKMPINWWTDRQNVIYSYNGIFHGHKKKKKKKEAMPMLQYGAVLPGPSCHLIHIELVLNPRHRVTYFCNLENFPDTC